MLGGILWAEVQDGPFKGWPLGAMMAVASGAEIEKVRDQMVAGLSEEQKRLEDTKETIRRLPDPGPEAIAQLRASAAEELRRQKSAAGAES